MALLEQRLRGDVTLHLQLTEGDIETRRFVANDSYLRLENVFAEATTALRTQAGGCSSPWKKPSSTGTTRYNSPASYG